MLDRIDREIVALLQKDARLANKELAGAVGLAASTCFERVRKLREAGVLRGAHTEISPDALGIGLQALIAIRLTQHSRETVEAFHDHLGTLNEVVAIYHVAGRQDFMVHVVVRDTEHLRDLAMDAFTTRPEVSQLETSLIYEYERKPMLPFLDRD